MHRALAMTAGLVVAGLLWAGGQTLQAHALADRAAWPHSEDFVLLPSPESAPITYLGYREAAADVTWARALVYYGSTKAEGSDYRYLEKFVDNIIALDPRFKRIYLWAAYAVTFKEDVSRPEEIEKAIKYFEAGMEQFPDDYELFWRAGIRYAFDLKSDDPAQLRRSQERGAELIEAAMRKPNAPPDLVTQAAALRTRLGQKDRAIDELREMILVTENPKAQAKMLTRLRYLVAEADQALVDEMLRAKEAFEAEWKTEMPWAPPSLFVILGPAPSPVVDPAALAVDRDLIGAEEEPTKDDGNGDDGGNGEGNWDGGADDGEGVAE